MTVIGLQTIPSQEDLDRIADSLSPINLSGVTVTAAVATFVVSLVVARLSRRAVRRFGARVEFVAPPTVDAVARITSYVIVVLGFFAALAILGIDLIPLLGGFGLLIVVVALALRSFLENFAAGMSLHVERPLELGDEVVVAGIEGEVEAISARTLQMRTMDGRRAYIPNRDVLDGPIVNLTAEGRRQSTIDVGLAYDTDLAAASIVLLEAAQRSEGVVDDPDAEVYIREFGDSTINARVRFWHGPGIREGWQVRHNVAVEVKRALDGEGIVIAYPQRVLWNGSEDATS